MNKQDRISEIEYKIARGEMSAAQVFTQMRQLVQAARTQVPASGEMEPFVLGNTYQTFEGREVKFVKIHNAGTSYETMEDEEGVNRYTRRLDDMGRCTGRSTDYPKNVAPSYPHPPAARQVPEGFALIPQSLCLDYGDIEHIMTMTGWDEGPEGFSEGVLWVGTLEDDDGKRTHGLNISCSECMEEGAIQIRQFDAPDLLTTTPEAVGCGWMLTETHKGMRISAEGVLGRVRGQLKFGAQEMLKHLEAMAEAFYAGNMKAVDQFLQTWDLDQKRPHPSKAAEQEGE